MCLLARSRGSPALRLWSASRQRRPGPLPSAPSGHWWRHGATGVGGAHTPPPPPPPPHPARRSDRSVLALGLCLRLDLGQVRPAGWPGPACRGPARSAGSVRMAPVTGSCARRGGDTSPPRRAWALRLLPKTPHRHGWQRRRPLRSWPLLPLRAPASEPGGAGGSLSLMPAPVRAGVGTRPARGGRPPPRPLRGPLILAPALRPLAGGGGCPSLP